MNHLSLLGICLLDLSEHSIAHFLVSKFVQFSEFGIQWNTAILHKGLYNLQPKQTSMIIIVPHLLLIAILLITV